MIDDLATRAAMTAASFLLLATGVSIFRLSDEDATREAAEEVAAHLARQLDAIGGMDEEVRFQGGEGPLSLPRSLSGSPYRVEIRPSDVRVVSGAIMAVAPVHTRVHPFEPDQEAYTADDLATLDTSVLLVNGGQLFVVERTLRWVQSHPAYLTFAYLPP